MAGRVPEYKKRRYIKLGFPIVFLALCTSAWDSGKFSYWGFALVAWGVYELWVVPTRCKATTTRKGSDQDNTVGQAGAGDLGTGQTTGAPNSRPDP